MKIAEITHASASANILAAVEAKTLTQGKWHDVGKDGREIACLLGSIHPQVGLPSDCSGGLMPLWLAELSLTLFDGVDPSEIYPIAERYGRLIDRWHVLSGKRWKALFNNFLAHVIDYAVANARPVAKDEPYWAAVEAACTRCKEVITTGEEQIAGYGPATVAAANAAAANAAARTVLAIATATDAATIGDSSAAYLAEAAARTAVSAAVASYTADIAARTAARTAPYTDAALNLFRFLLDQIDEEVTTAESH